MGSHQTNCSSRCDAADRGLEPRRRNHRARDEKMSLTHHPKSCSVSPLLRVIPCPPSAPLPLRRQLTEQRNRRVVRLTRALRGLERRALGLVRDVEPGS